MEKKKKFIIDTVFYLLIILLLWAAGKYILPALWPFIIAFLIASLLQVPVRIFCKKNGRIKKLLSILICAAFFILMFFCVAVAGVKLFNSVSGFLKSVPSMYQNQILPLFTELLNNVRLSNIDIAINIENIIQDFLNNVGNYITDFSVNAIKIVSGGIASIPGVFVKIVICIIATFFFIVDYDKIIRFFVNCIPKEKEGTFKMLQGYVKNTLMVYLKSYTLLFLLTYVELSIGFKLMGLPYPLTIALIVAVFDILPVLGTGGILLPWAVILLIMRNIPMGVGMIVLYLIITAIRNSLEPRLVGMQIGLHPLATLIAMFVGVNLLGLPGLILFPVVLVVWTNMKKAEKAME